MPIRRRILLAGAAALSMPAIRRSYAASTIKIGVLSDMSGQYAEASGPGDFLAAQMAAEDFMKSHPELKVEVIQGDMLLKPDVGAAIARGWYDQDGVDAIFDIPQSAVAIAVGQVAKEKDKVVVFTSAGIPDLTGKYCTPNQIQWTYDLWGNANAITRGVIAAGGDSWFFIKPDYISGHTMVKDTAAIVERLGGKVAGMAAYPFPGTTDFSAYILQAQTSKAKVLCLANAGDDTANCIKQAHEFGLPQAGVKIAALVYQDYIARSVGLDLAQGIIGAMPFYWDMNDDTRAFTARFSPRYHNARPQLLSRRQLFGGHALPESGRRDGSGQGKGERPGGRRADEGATGRRSAVWQRCRARGRQIHPCQPGVGDEDSGGIERRMGPIQTVGDDTAGPGIPADGGARLRAGENLEDDHAERNVHSVWIMPLRKALDRVQHA